ncbi:MAG: NAD-dependent deacylase [Phycisphaerales bacterium]|nr:NAD-dependent deacylase [Phycisphaerales bacterium]
MEPHLQGKLDEIAARLRKASSVAVMTGAGVSAESGVPTFRDAGGLWEGHRIEDVGTPEGFTRDPLLVWRFYNARRRNLLDVAPNAAHHALANLERRCRDFALITQNVDGLHARAGTPNPIELHGNIWLNTCTGCTHYEWADATWRATGNPSAASFPDDPRCPKCAGRLRPGVVWFGEMLPDWAVRRAEQAVCRCDVMLVIGTSAVVYPAAGLAHLAAARGAFVVEINPQRTPLSKEADAVLSGKAGEIMPALLQRVASS